MNEITVTQPTMTSLKLVDIINEVRKLNGKPEIRHDNLLQKIETHPGISSPEFSGGYIDEQGKTRKLYNLPRRECDLLVMSESLALQAQVYDRLVKELGEKATRQLTASEVKRIEHDYAENLKHSIEHEVGDAMIWAVRLADEDNDTMLNKVLDKIDFDAVAKLEGRRAEGVRDETLAYLKASSFVDQMRRGEPRHPDRILDVLAFVRAAVAKKKADENLAALRLDRAKRPPTLEQIDAYDMAHKHDNRDLTVDPGRKKVVRRRK